MSAYFWGVLFIVLQSTLGLAETIQISTPSGGNFTLPQHSSGQTFELKQLEGKTVFLFFGFTQCPQVCPTTVQKLKDLERKLIQDKKTNFHFLFVSIDPRRDSKEVLKKYAHGLGRNFSAGTSSKKKLEAILAQYGARSAEIRTQNTTFIDHTDSVFVIDPIGRWVDTIPYTAEISLYENAYHKSQRIYEEVQKMIAARKVQILGRNKTCDLNVSDCSIKTKDGETIAVSIEKRPLKTQETLKINVTLITDSKRVPLELDFTGVNLNMGLIRPKLKPDGNGIYSGTFEIPICEIKKMNWNVRLLIKEADQSQSAYIFNMTTLH